MTHQIVGTDVHEAFWIISNLQKSHFQGGKDFFLQSSTGPKKHATSLLQGSRGTPEPQIQIPLEETNHNCLICCGIL